MAKSKRLSLLLWVLTIFPAVIVLVTEANKRILVGYIRIVDFVDLVIVAPFFLIIFLALHALVFEQREHSNWKWISLALFGIFLYGHSMHVTANAINTYSTEIQDYRNIIPSDTYALIYFFDEDLGHWLFFLGLFGLLGIWVTQSSIRDNRVWNSLVSGSLFGVFYAIVIIESSQYWIGPFVALWLIGCASYWCWDNKIALKEAWKINPFFRFVVSIAVFLIVGQIIYYLLVGGFIQPSELGY
jgi:hypothetical protein